MAKTLIKEISQSPYYARDIYGVFSRILFKPGYALQSAELIELQDILQEQIKRFGNHIFKDGSIVTGGSSNFNSCYLYSLEENAEMALEIGVGNDIVFTESGNASNILARSNFISLKEAFVLNGIVYPNFVATERNISGLLTGTVDAYWDNAGTYVKIGTLITNSVRNGMYAHIDSSIFYVSGYFTNISSQNYIFSVDDISNFDAEVGIELVWNFVDVEDSTYGAKLYDPAQNSYNANAPGADRLELKLQLTHHDLGYTQTEDDWYFVPLMKFKNGNLTLHVRYPIYNELGDTLARRTYEINGNFVVDNFSLNVNESTQLDGTHYVTNIAFNPATQANTITITGVDSSYMSLLNDDIANVPHYLMFGNEINYNRLLLIESIVSNNTIKVSDIHYDSYLDEGTGISIPVVGQTFSLLRNEENLNYEIGSGKAYLKGYRFETTFTTNLEKKKSRKYNTTTNDIVYQNEQSLSTLPYIFKTENFDFDQLQVVDLHPTHHYEVYEITFDVSFSINAGDTIKFGGATFKSIDGASMFELIERTKSTTSGVPTYVSPGTIYSIQLRNGVTPSPAESYTLSGMVKKYAFPYERVANETYSANTVPSQANNVNLTTNQVEFLASSGNYSDNFSFGDIVNVLDSGGNFIAEGKIIELSGVVDTNTTLEVIATNIITGSNYTLEKVSAQDYYTRQYQSTKIGSARVYNAMFDQDRLNFSHLNMDQEVKTFVVSKLDSANNLVSGTTLDLSFVDGIYNNMTLQYGSSSWTITDYDGANQTFTIATSTSNPITFNVGNSINLFGIFTDVGVATTSSYLNGTEFAAELDFTADNIVNLPSQTEKRFVPLLTSGDGEIKSVDVDTYSVFYQDSVETTVLTDQLVSTLVSYFTQNIGTLPTSLIRVYALEDIPDGSGGILYFKGEVVPVSSANITGGDLNITLSRAYAGGTEFLIHANLPVSTPQKREKTLSLETSDTFTVNAVSGVLESGINTRHFGQNVFELKHSDIYRIRSIKIGNGKTTAGNLVDYTDYFELDNGQRETHYDHGRIKLRPYLKLPTPVAPNEFLYFEVQYDYFTSTDGHFFTVDSYLDIHYRNIPTYVDPNKVSYPLRNVIDWRPVRNPIGSPYEYENEVSVLDETDLDYEYYYNQNKIVYLERTSGSEIVLNVSEEIDYNDNEDKIKLYDVIMPAYTFRFEDVRISMIDNKNYTMRDISKLQKRLENLEDIVQLNSLELQAIQSRIVDSSGNPSFTNGLLVDMFAGFAVAHVSEDGFAASIDLENMKLYPEFETFVSRLKLLNDIPPTNIEKKDNIIMLPIASEVEVANNFNGDTSTKNSNLSSVEIGKLSLHPFNDVWFSTTTPPRILLNDDNQFNNWIVLGNQGFGTQWADWEQFWAGVPVGQNILSLGNTTLSQKTGLMINNKNNIAKIIDEKKVNTTIYFFNRESRIGFIGEMLNTGDTFDVRLNGVSVVTAPGQRLTVTSTTNTLETLKRNYLYREVSQTISATQTAFGKIQKIIESGVNQFEFYITNIGTDLFQSGTLNGFTGTVTAVSLLNAVDSFGIICGDFTIADGSNYPANQAIEVQLIDSSDQPAATSQYYLGGLLPTKTSFTRSVRPVQKRLFTQTRNEYIDDKTLVIHSATSVPTPLHQGFILAESCFISKIEFKVSAPTAVDMLVTIQPYVNANLSPSLVVPFSEKVVKIPASASQQTVVVEFDVPVYIPANQNYAFTFKTNASCEVYTRTSVATETTFIYSLEAAKPAGTTPTTISNEVIQIVIHKAQFNSGDQSFLLNFEDSSLDEVADRLRVNLNSIDLPNTTMKLGWKARNYNSVTNDLLYKEIKQNETQLAEVRKTFNNNTFLLNVTMNTVDSNFTPMLDLDRIYVNLIKHQINNGEFTSNGVNVVRSGGSNTARVDIVSSTGKTMNFDVDSSGNVLNLYSDPRFLLETSSYSNTVQQYNPTTSILEPLDSGTSITFSLDTEFDADTRKGNLEYRYYSRIVTLVDSFDALQLHVQMDAILKTTTDVYVYYRILDSSQTVSNIETQPFHKMNLLTNPTNKYSNDGFSRTLEFNTQRASTATRFKYFQVKVGFVSSNYVDVPVLENIRILALDN